MYIKIIEIALLIILLVIGLVLAFGLYLLPGVIRDLFRRD